MTSSQPLSEKRFLILSPLRSEYENLVHSLKTRGLKEVQISAGRLKISSFPERGWLLAVAGHGKTQFGIQTQYLLHHFPEVKGVVCAGCAGSLHEEVSIFDVVVASKTIEHDFRLKFIKKPDPEFSAAPSLLQLFKSSETTDPPAAPFKLHFGAIASGDEDIIDEGRAAELRTQTQALAVAWEGAGGARACLFNKVPFIEVRGITDRADSGGAIDFTRHLQKAMEHVAEALMKVLKV